MTNCIDQKALFQPVKSRKIDISFDGGCITSDAGVLLFRKADKLINLTDRIATLLPDKRRTKSIKHSALEMLRQRVYGLCMGYEDLNDHDYLRTDIAHQTAVETNDALASSPTLCRFEASMTRETAVRINESLIDLFIESHIFPPDELILDFDATDDPIHGHQEDRFFHGYYDCYCYLPLYVFCGHQILCAMLRPSKIDGAKYTGAILKMIVRKLRQAWPDVCIIFRGDSGFCRQSVLSWCDRNDVGFIVGMARNSRLIEHSRDLLDQAARVFDESNQKVRLFSEFSYAANSWKYERQLIVKAEHGPKGSNPRFIVTNLSGNPQFLYDDIYCARGDMENRIKEKQLDLFADRTSCSKFWPNQFRLLLSSLAYVLMETIRRVGLAGTELTNAQCGTIRLKLLKIGAVIIRNTRRIRFHLSSHYPWQHLFLLAAKRLDTS
ncbi:IS1380 family transposase [bacterium]|nr:IS1380 family transposase [bacterium]